MYCEYSRHRGRGAARRGAARRQGPNDGKFLEALHYFVVHNITWRALPEKFGHWNSVWKRFWRLSRSGTFEAFFNALAAMSEAAHLVQMFDSTVARAHVSAAGAKGGSMIRRLAAREAVSPAKLNESSHSTSITLTASVPDVNTRKHFPPARLCISREVKILKGRAPAKPIVVSVPINTAPYILQKSPPGLRC